MTFFDMGSSNTFNRWEWLSSWGMPKQAPEWPPYLTCPAHYRIPVIMGVDWGWGYDEMALFTREQYEYLIERINNRERQKMFTEDPSPGSSITEKNRQAIEAAEKCVKVERIAPDAVQLTTFNLTVRDTNNLVRFLYTNGWISHEQHPHVHALLDEMIAWLERQDIKVSMDMKEML